MTRTVAALFVCVFLHAGLVAGQPTGGSAVPPQGPRVGNPSPGPAPGKGNGEKPAKHGQPGAPDRGKDNPQAARPDQEPTVNQDGSPVLSELETLRLENHLLRTRLAQVETQRATEQLSRQRTELDAAMTQAHPGWRMDWDTGRLVKAEQAAELPSAVPPGNQPGQPPGKPNP